MKNTMRYCVVAALALAGVVVADPRPGSPSEGTKYRDDRGKPWIYTNGAWQTDWNEAGKRNRIAAVWIDIGQSNAAGFSPLAIRSPEDWPLPNMYQVSRGNVEGQYPESAGASGDIIPAYQPLQHAASSGSKGIGMGFEFVRAYSLDNPHVDSYIVPDAKGSTSIGAGEGGEWAATTGSLYVTSVGRVDALVTKLEAEYQQVIFPAILWHQGESDHTNANYEVVLENLIQAYRGRYSAYGEIPWVCGTVRKKESGGVNARLWDMMNLTPSVATVDMMDLAGREGDEVHYTYDSLKAAGARMYAGWKALKSGDAGRTFITLDDSGHLPANPNRLYTFNTGWGTSSAFGGDLTLVGDPYRVTGTNGTEANGVVGLMVDDQLTTDRNLGSNTSMTFLVKFRSGPVDVNQSVMSDGNFHLRVEPGGQLVLAIAGNGSTEVSSGAVKVDDGVWHNVGVNYLKTNGTAKMWVDGVYMGSASFGTGEDSAANIVIGQRPGQSDQDFPALFDHVAIYNSTFADSTMSWATTMRN